MRESLACSINHASFVLLNTPALASTPCGLSAAGPARARKPAQPKAVAGQAELLAWLGMRGAHLFLGVHIKKACGSNEILPDMIALRGGRCIQSNGGRSP